MATAKYLSWMLIAVTPCLCVPCWCLYSPILNCPVYMHSSILILTHLSFYPHCNQNEVICRVSNNRIKAWDLCKSFSGDLAVIVDMFCMLLALFAWWTGPRCLWSEPQQGTLVIVSDIVTFPEVIQTNMSVDIHTYIAVQYLNTLYNIMSFAYLNMQHNWCVN